MTLADELTSLARFFPDEAFTLKKAAMYLETYEELFDLALALEHRPGAEDVDETRQRYLNLLSLLAMGAVEKAMERPEIKEGTDEA